MSSVENKKKFHSAAKEIAYIALAVAVITACAWISIPVGIIPITLQTLAVALVGALLGWKRGTAAIFVYILMGLIGIPVFSGATGVVRLFGPTGGYIFGFLFLALIPGLAKLIPVKNSWGRIAVIYAGMVLGMAVCYAFGTGWYMILTKCTLKVAITTCVLPFIVPDLIKFVVSVLLTVRLEKYIK